ncbi:MAG TPA: nucleotidyltransferase domain-containing protein [Limnochordales bacterium]
MAEAFEKVLSETSRACREVFGERLVAVAVFGSVARGTPRPDSDVDLLVVVRDLPLSRLARVQEFEEVEARVAGLLQSLAGQGVLTELSPVLKTPEEVEAGSPLLLDMVYDARILYDPHGFLRGRLERLRARLQELGARRVRYGGSWYWDLKPDFRPGDVIEL